jgi:hypothetical protein
VSPVETLQRAAAAGVLVTLNGDRLVVRSSAPPPAEILGALVEHKADIIDLLGRTCAHCGQPGGHPRSVHSGPPDEILGWRFPRASSRCTGAVSTTGMPACRLQSEQGADYDDLCGRD